VDSVKNKEETRKRNQEAQVEQAEHERLIAAIGAMTDNVTVARERLAACGPWDIADIWNVPVEVTEKWIAAAVAVAKEGAGLFRMVDERVEHEQPINWRGIVATARSPLGKLRVILAPGADEVADVRVDVRLMKQRVRGRLRVKIALALAELREQREYDEAAAAEDPPKKRARKDGQKEYA